MSSTRENRCRMTSVTTGTGTLTLGSVITGYTDFSLHGDGNTVPKYCIEGHNGDDTLNGEWEITTGTYTASGTTLSRAGSPESSSNSGALVNFSADHLIVYEIVSAEDINNLSTGSTSISNGSPVGIVSINSSGEVSYTLNSVVIFAYSGSHITFFDFKFLKLGASGGVIFDGTGISTDRTVTWPDISGTITIQGNSFNGANQLVQLNGSSEIPALSGVNLTSLNASNISSGTLDVARLPATPAANGTYSPVTSITIVNGIITAIS